MVVCAVGCPLRADTKGATGALTQRNKKDRRAERALFSTVCQLLREQAPLATFVQRIGRDRRRTLPVQTIFRTDEQQRFVPTMSSVAEIDVNTPPDYAELFNAEQAIKIFDELTALAAEIAEKGDRP